MSEIDFEVKKAKYTVLVPVVFAKPEGRKTIFLNNLNQRKKKKAKVYDLKSFRLFMHWQQFYFDHS